VNGTRTPQLKIKLDIELIERVNVELRGKHLPQPVNEEKGVCNEIGARRTVNRGRE
jgi:hypothetical protein